MNKLLRKCVLFVATIGIIASFSSCDFGEEKVDRSTTTNVVYRDGNVEYREEVNSAGQTVRWEKVTKKDDGKIESEILMEDRNWYQ